MNYQVWLKEEYEEVYRKVECGDLLAVKREIDKAVRAGQEPILTVEVPYTLGIKIEEVGAEKKTLKERFAAGVKEPKKEEPVETAESKTKPD